jgi:hemolysin activation/secretion protein
VPDGKKFVIRRALILPLYLPAICLPIVAVSFAAEAPITPGSVKNTLEAEKRPLPAIPPQVVVPVQSAPSGHDPRAKRFRVNAFTFQGNTVFDSRTLKTQLERFLDMELNLYDLNMATDEITEFYQARGYLLARASVPPQKVVDGDVKITVVEGRIGKVNFNGNQRHSVAFLSARTKVLQPGTTVTANSLESSMLLLNEIPGVSAKAVLDPGADVGTTDANINITEKLLGLSLGVNNSGRTETGKNKAETTLNINSPLGWGDQLTLSGSSTQQKLVRYWKAGYSLPLDTEGTRLSIGNSRAEYEVSGALAALGLTGDIHTTDITVTHPLVRMRNDNESVSLNLKRSRLRQFNLDVPAADNAINVLTAGYQLTRVHDDSSVTGANLSLATNFKSIDGTTRQDALYARTEVDVNHTTPFYGKWDMYLRGNIVHSKEMLPDSEKFSLGGPGSVRAFRPSEVRGDSGYQGTVELRHPFTVAQVMGSFRLTSDVGQVTYKTPNFKDSRDRLRSVGFGASVYPFSGATLSFDAARQVGPSGASNDGKKSRIWINFSANL